jgi:hypothetical protein
MNALSVIMRGERKRGYHFEVFVYYSVILCTVAMKRVTNSHQRYSFHAFTTFSIRIHWNVLRNHQLVSKDQSLRVNAFALSSEPLSSNGLLRHNTYILRNWIKYSTHNSLTHSWSWALLEKLPIVQPLKKFPAFYGTRRFITMFTRAIHWSLSWARSIQSMPSHPISIRSFLHTRL